jgi:hypothetical protein
MTRGDQLIERAADRLETLARQAAGEAGLKGKLAKPLADDAELLRGMRPSRIAARLRGDAHGEEARPSMPLPPAEPEHRREKSPRNGPPAIALAVGALALGILIAKVVEWRSHAHPR